MCHLVTLGAQMHGALTLALCLTRAVDGCRDIPTSEEQRELQ